MAEIFDLRTMFFILAVLPVIGAIIVLLKVQETVSLVLIYEDPVTDSSFFHFFKSLIFPT